ncbi:MAG: CHASE3 domain-containing protein [Magnetococcales bacterium]|nr:CHASE3 domain-containing protein [Magnetococcales bacterium]
MKSVKFKILLGISIPLLLMAILGYINVSSISSISQTNERVEHTYKVLGKAASIVSAAVDMETGMRGYLLAGKEGFLDPYNSGEKATYELISSLSQTVSDNPKQVKRLNEVEDILKGWQQNVTEPTIELRRKIGDAKTMNDISALVGEARGKKYFDKFRGQIATFISREQSLLNKRRAEFTKAFNKLKTLAEAGNSDSSLLNVMKNNEGWVSHTNKVIAKANDILAAAVDMETGMRGYLLAGEEDFLDPYKGGSDKFFKLTSSLKQTVSDNPAQVHLINEMEQTIKGWKNNVTEPAISLRRKIGHAKTMDDMAKLIG